MTKEEFRKLLKSTDKVEDGINYGWAIALIGLGIYFIISFYSKYGFSDYKSFVILIVPLFFFGSGALLIYRIPLDYRIGIMNSKKSIEEKKKIVKKYIGGLDLKGQYEEEHYLECQTNKKLLYWKLLMVFQFDEEKIMFNVQAGDKSNGVFDFGIARRKAKEIKEYLEANLE